jgi:hypothetical protein
LPNVSPAIGRREKTNDVVCSLIGSRIFPAGEGTAQALKVAQQIIATLRQAKPLICMA